MVDGEVCRSAILTARPLAERSRSQRQRSFTKNHHPLSTIHHSPSTLALPVIPLLGCIRDRLIHRFLAQHCRLQVVVHHLLQQLDVFNHGDEDFSGF